MNDNVSQDHGPRIRTGGGRGIIIPVGDRAQLAGAYVSVSVLRGQLGCKLTIHIVHNGASALYDDSARLFKACPRSRAPSSQSTAAD